MCRGLTHPLLYRKIPSEPNKEDGLISKVLDHPQRSSLLNQR